MRGVCDLYTALTFVCQTRGPGLTNALRSLHEVRFIFSTATLDGWLLKPVAQGTPVDASAAASLPVSLPAGTVEVIATAFAHGGSSVRLSPADGTKLVVTNDNVLSTRVGGRACHAILNILRAHPKNCTHSERTPVAEIAFELSMFGVGNALSLSETHFLCKPPISSSAKAMPESRLCGVEPVPATAVVTYGCVIVADTIACHQTRFDSSLGLTADQGQGVAIRALAGVWQRTRKSSRYSRCECVKG